MAIGRRSPLPTSRLDYQDTMPLGSSGGRAHYISGGLGREEEEVEEEGIPLVEYHLPVSPTTNLQVPLPDSWRSNGGARPKQRYEVGIEKL